MAVALVRDIPGVTPEGYDAVGVFDMPNDEALTTLALKVGAGGAVRTESLRAFTAEEMGGILANLG